MLTSDFSWVFWAEEPHRAMKVFVSYSSHDDVAVRSLVADLERARQQVWLDQDLGGGDAWWAEILEQIRACTVFMFALSNNSLYSTPCRAELDYAKSLRLPILPVQIGEVGSYRTDPIFSMQFVDYRDATKSSIIDLVSALHERGTRRVELPDPLPEPPPIPYEYLQRLGASIHGSAELSSAAQAAMSLELRTALQDEQDNSVRGDIRALLRALRGRRDITYATVREIDSILDKDAAGPLISAKPPSGPALMRARCALSERHTRWRRDHLGVTTSAGRSPLEAADTADPAHQNDPRRRHHGNRRRHRGSRHDSRDRRTPVIPDAPPLSSRRGCSPCWDRRTGIPELRRPLRPGTPRRGDGQHDADRAGAVSDRARRLLLPGIRLSDGALIALANAVRSAGGFDVTNPADGTRYEIRPHRLTLLRTDGQVAAQETMVAYWSISTS